MRRSMPTGKPGGPRLFFARGLARRNRRRRAPLRVHRPEGSSRRLSFSTGCRNGESMRKALVAIGVDGPASGFPRLQAAADGARQIAAWGAQQNFDVSVLTDDGGKSVTLADAFAAVKSFVDARIYAQLVVYFSGHGVLLSPDTEVWLLSGALANPNE